MAIPIATLAIPSARSAILFSFAIVFLATLLLVTVSSLILFVLRLPAIVTRSAAVLPVLRIASSL